MKKVLKKIYELIPFKVHIFTLLKKVYSPSESIYKHLHFKGDFNLKVDKDKKVKLTNYGYQLENEMFWGGVENSWEKESFKLWIKLSKISDVIFDIGANTGIYSLLSRAVNEKATIYAFEPIPVICQKMNESLKKNNFNVFTYEYALSNFTGEAKVYMESTEHVYSVTVNKNLSDASVPVFETQIKTKTLNEFVKENSLQKIDLMKIDVETHEPEVLEGFSEYLEQFKPTLLIEILNEEVGEKVNKLVENCNYLVFNIDEKGEIRQEEKITKSDYYNYLLCSLEIAKQVGLK